VSLQKHMDMPKYGHTKYGHTLQKPQQKLMVSSHTMYNAFKIHVKSTSYYKLLIHNGHIHCHQCRVLQTASNNDKLP